MVSCVTFAQPLYNDRFLVAMLGESNFKIDGLSWKESVI